ARGRAGSCSASAWSAPRPPRVRPDHGSSAADARTDPRRGPPPSRVSPHDLKSVLRDPAEAATLDVHGRTDAAVLVPLYEHEGDLHLVFTRRRDDLRRHPGEISFPGGRQDEPDEDLVATALREAEEEIGLPVDAVE